MVGGVNRIGILSTKKCAMNQLTRAHFLRGNWQGQPVSPSIHAVARVLPGCLAYRGVFCRSCADDCEPQVIVLQPVVGSVARPGIDPERCTGCGDCRASCPVQAIVLVKRDVDGESI
jgi:ferredoxin